MVRNGVDAAARQMDVTVSYQSPDTFSVTRMRELIDEAVDSQPDGLVVSIPDPAVGPADPARRCAPASRSSRSTPAPTCGASSASSPTSASPRRRRGASAGERLAAAGVRNAICINHEVGNKALEIRCAAFARRCASTAGARTCSRSTSRTATWPRRSSPRRSSAARRTGCSRLGTGGSAAALDAKKLGGRATRVKIGTFDLQPEVLEAIKDGRILFAVDQQAYLQGYMPIVMLTQEARYGLFPSRGEVVATGPNFVTRETRADLALQLSGRGIR